MSPPRKTKDWLQSYLEYTSSQAALARFHLWCGIGVLAAALERRCYVYQGYFKKYANMFTVLVGDSASYKSTSIDMALDIAYAGEEKYEAEPLNVVSQQITPEALLVDLARHYENMTHYKGVEPASAGFPVADELSNLIGRSRQDSKLIQTMTKLYDCPARYSYTTIKRDKLYVNNACLNLLGGSTPKWLKDSLPEGSIEGGFVGRIQFVFSPHRGKRIAFPELTQKQLELRDGLAQDYAVIRQLSGEFLWSDDAKKWYTHWFEHGAEKEETDLSLSGYYNRKGDTVIKVAMVCSAARSDKKLITLDDVCKAYRWVMDNERFLPRIFEKLRSTPLGELIIATLEIIEKRGRKGIKRSALLNALGSRGVTSQSLSILTSTLLQREAIYTKEEKGKRGRPATMYYAF